MEVEATWAFYQHMVAAYREPDRAKGKEMMQSLIAKLGRAVPKKLIELAALGRTLKKRSADILAYFDRPGTSNGPTEAICESGSGWSGTGRSGWMSVVSNRV